MESQQSSLRQSPYHHVLHSDLKDPSNRCINLGDLKGGDIPDQDHVTHHNSPERHNKHILFGDALIDGTLALDCPSRTSALQPNERWGCELWPCEIHKSVSGPFFRTTFPGMCEQTESRKVMVRISRCINLVGSLTEVLHDRSIA